MLLCAGNSCTVLRGWIPCEILAALTSGSAVVCHGVRFPVIYNIFLLWLQILRSRTNTCRKRKETLLSRWQEAAVLRAMPEGSCSQRQQVSFLLHSSCGKAANNRSHRASGSTSAHALTNRRYQGVQTVVIPPTASRLLQLATLPDRCLHSAPTRFWQPASTRRCCLQLSASDRCSQSWQDVRPGRPLSASGFCTLRVHVASAELVAPVAYLASEAERYASICLCTSLLWSV